MNIETKDFVFGNGLKKFSLVLVLLGVIGLVVSFMSSTAVGWVDYLVGNIYVVTIAVSGIFFMAVAGILQASWVAPFKRIPEAMTKYLPVGGLLMLVTYFGLHTIYEWTHTEMVMNDPILREKIAWLNEPFFMIRMAVIFVVWILVARALVKISVRQDNGEDMTAKLTSTSAIGMIFFAVTICVAAFDWIMSVEPHWFSTIFGVYVFAGSFVSGIAFVTIAVIMLKKWGYFKGVINDNHLHDLGKWMFGISTFWAYIWISQYLLIWYANIPEETEYYVSRHAHWNTMFFVNLIINWGLPFFLLMSRGAKRNTNRLLLVAGIILVGHFVDLYLMVAPKIFHHYDVHHISGFGILQVLQGLGFLGLFIFVTASALSKMKLVGTGDPNLEEGIHLHQ